MVIGEQVKTSCVERVREERSGNKKKVKERAEEIEWVRRG